jgi:hypothetical protein
MRRLLRNKPRRAPAYPKQGAPVAAAIGRRLIQSSPAGLRTSSIRASLRKGDVLMVTRNRPARP